MVLLNEDIYIDYVRRSRNMNYNNRSKTFNSLNKHFNILQGVGYKHDMQPFE